MAVVEVTLAVEDALVLEPEVGLGNLDLSMFQSVQSVLVSLQGGMYWKQLSEEAEVIGQVEARLSQNFLQGN